MGVSPSSGTAGTAAGSSDSAGPSVRFGMAHALVIIVCIVTAAVLAELGMPVEDVLFLLGGAGSIGATVVVTGRRSGRFGRFLRAYFNSGS